MSGELTNEQMLDKVKKYIRREQRFYSDEQAVDYWFTLTDQQKIDLFHKALEMK